MEVKMPGQIVKLDEDVINRIAAGEVIQRPANALKELLENALDAKSKNIQVIVKAGGMKLLQIQDDGTGVRREDMGIVCERFTTSKLRKFEDLQTIGTYGFRGEALASISHVAHLTIITKTDESPCAFKAEYSDGKLKEYPVDSGIQNPKPCAGKQGTTIVVEDLFYNMDTRRKALKSSADEHSKILDVITRYAVHNAGVGISLKKFGETMTEIRTPASSNVLENIKILYGAAIARELVPVECEDNVTQFKMDGYVSNVNYSTKKLTFILFINNRLVDSSALRKSIESVYANYVPKGSHPFVYFNISIEPKNVDVNVHPTKHEVHFLHEDMIVSTISNAIENTLLGSNESRTFFVQSLLPGATGAFTSTATAISKKRSSEGISASTSSKSNSSQETSIQSKNMVRTDPKSQKLDKFLTSTPNSDSSVLKSFNDSPSKLCISVNNKTVVGQPGENLEEMPSSSSSNPLPATGVPQRREIRLRSIKIMKAAISEDCQKDLITILRNHTFVGSVDRSLALFQHDTTLYIGSTFRLSAELFYQKMVHEFGNFGRIVIDDPIEIKELVSVALSFEGNPWIKEGESYEEIANQVHNVLMGKRKMLDDYFSLNFDEEGRLTSIPLLLENYFPCMEGIPDYLMNLAKKVNWTDERACFESFCRQTSKFYAVQPGGDELIQETSLNGQTWKWTIEHVVYPEIKKTLLPPKRFADDSTIVIVTTLPHLYKVFERC